MASTQSLPSRVSALMSTHGLNAMTVLSETGVAPAMLARWLQGGVQDRAIEGKVASRMERWCRRIEARANRRSTHATSVPREHLVSISLRLTMLQGGFGNKSGSGIASLLDTLLWNLHETRITPKQFLTQMIAELNLESWLWLEPLLKQFEKQLAEHRERMDNGEDGDALREETKEESEARKMDLTHGIQVIVPASVPSSPTSQPMQADDPESIDDAMDEGGSQETQLVRIELDIYHDHTQLRDFIAWDIDSPLQPDPETFATTYVREVGLVNQFVPKVAWSIREQLQRERNARAKGIKSPLYQIPRHDEFSKMLRNSHTALVYTPRFRALTIRQDTAPNQRPPPPYVALYHPPTHRHAMMVGEILDMRGKMAPPALPTAPLGVMPPPALIKSASKKAVAAVRYTFARCNEDSLFLKISAIADKKRKHEASHADPASVKLEAAPAAAAAAPPSHAKKQRLSRGSAVVPTPAPPSPAAAAPSLVLKLPRHIAPTTPAAKRAPPPVVVDAMDESGDMDGEEEKVPASKSKSKKKGGGGGSSKRSHRAAPGPSPSPTPSPPADAPVMEATMSTSGRLVIRRTH